MEELCDKDYIEYLENLCSQAHLCLITPEINENMYFHYPDLLTRLDNAAVSKRPTYSDEVE